MLSVQDRYKYDDKDKWEAFSTGLGQIWTLYDGSNNNDFVNLDFLSTNGSAAYGHPYSHAKTLNAMFLNADLSELIPPGHNHWIITDFSTAELARHIYEVNFR